MSKKTISVESKDLEEIKKILRQGRNRYDNALLEIESVWHKIGPHDYTRRAKIVKAVLGMVEVDQSLKMWENKLK